MCLSCYNQPMLPPTYLVVRMGLPRAILSDNAKEFDNILDKFPSTVLGIHRRLTTPSHPQVPKPKLATKG